MSINIDEALEIVEKAGYTVVRDRDLRDYYAKNEKRLSNLLRKAKAGDWIAAEALLKAVTTSDHIHYSRSLSEFIKYITLQLLTRKAFTKARSGKQRIKNPILSALIETNARKDYELQYRKEAFQSRFNIHWENGTQDAFGDLERGESKRSRLLKILAPGENRDSHELSRWIHNNEKNRE